MLSIDITNEFFKNPSSSEIDHLVYSSVKSLRLTLDSIVPLKKKRVKHSKLAPWYNSNTQASRNLGARKKINHLLPSVDTNTLSRIEISEKAENITNYLDSFSLITLDQLTKIISFSKSTTCILDPIPTKSLKEVLPLIDSTLIIIRICTTVL